MPCRCDRRRSSRACARSSRTSAERVAYLLSERTTSRWVIDHPRDEAHVLGLVLGLLGHRQEQEARHIDDADRVAVRLRPREVRIGDLACCSGLVDDDELGLGAESLLDERRQLARHQVGAAAGGEADDDLDRLVVGPGGQGGESGCQCDRGHDRPQFSSLRVRGLLACVATSSPQARHSEKRIIRLPGKSRLDWEPPNRAPRATARLLSRPSRAPPRVRKNPPPP